MDGRAAPKTTRTRVTTQRDLLDAIRSNDRDEICALMDAITPEMLGLRTPFPDGFVNDVPVIRTQPVCETSQMELVIFLLPKGARIPLHDHPGMSVYSRLLYGSLAVRTFDWLEPPEHAELQGASHARLWSCELAYMHTCSNPRGCQGAPHSCVSIPA